MMFPGRNFLGHNLISNARVYLKLDSISPFIFRLAVKPFPSFYIFLRMDNETDQIIWQLAENYDDMLLLKLHKLLLTRNLFIPSIDRTIRIAEISDAKLAELYTGMHPSWGGAGFSTLSYQDAFNMVLALENIDGVLLHNKKDSWVGFDKSKIIWLQEQNT
jgi:hypothetical protein